MDMHPHTWTHTHGPTHMDPHTCNHTHAPTHMHPRTCLAIYYTKTLFLTLNNLYLATGKNELSASLPCLDFWTKIETFYKKHWTCKQKFYYSVKRLRSWSILRKLSTGINPFAMIKQSHLKCSEKGLASIAGSDSQGVRNRIWLG